MVLSGGIEFISCAFDDFNFDLDFEIISKKSAKLETQPGRQSQVSCDSPNTGPLEIEMILRLQGSKLPKDDIEIEIWEL